MATTELTGIQRYQKMYELESVKSQGFVVRGWWRFHYVQYAWLTAFGFACRVAGSREHGDTRRLTPEKLRRWSDWYVLGCLVLAVLLFGLRTVFEEGGRGSLDGIAAWAATIIGGYRVYEIVFAQSYYLLQTGTNRVTSFTRTLLFHFMFIVEISLHTSTIALHEEEGLSVWTSFGRAYQFLTLQGNFLDDRIIERLQVVYAGCTVVGLVILVGSIPMVVSASSKSLGEHA